MATYKMDVPLSAQAKANSCWNASAQMIWWYWQNKTGRQGPMWSLQKTWEDDTGIRVEQFIQLAQRVGMKPVLHQQSYNSGDLIWILKRFGPLWCAGMWYGLGHIVVLTGVKDDAVYINDPDRGIPKSHTVSWFNQKLSNHINGCLMYKDPAAY